MRFPQVAVLQLTYFVQYWLGAIRCLNATDVFLKNFGLTAWQRDVLLAVSLQHILPSGVLS